MTNLSRHFPDWPRRTHVRYVVQIIGLSRSDLDMDLSGCNPQRVEIACADFSDSRCATWLVVSPDMVKEFLAWLQLERVES